YLYQLKINNTMKNLKLFFFVFVSLFVLAACAPPNCDEGGDQNLYCFNVESKSECRQATKELNIYELGGNNNLMDSSKLKPLFCESDFIGTSCCLPESVFEASNCLAEPSNCYGLIKGTNNEDFTVNPQTCVDDEYFCLRDTKSQCCKDSISTCDSTDFCYPADSVENCYIGAYEFNIFNSESVTTFSDFELKNPDFCQTEYMEQLPDGKGCCLSVYAFEDAKCPDAAQNCYNLKPSNLETGALIYPYVCQGEEYFCLNEFGDSVCCNSEFDCEAEDIEDYDFCFGADSIEHCNEKTLALDLYSSTTNTQRIDTTNIIPKFCRTGFTDTFPGGKSCCIDNIVFSDFQCIIDETQCRNIDPISDDSGNIVTPLSCSDREYICMRGEVAQCCDPLPPCDPPGVDEQKVCYPADSEEDCFELTQNLQIFSTVTANKRVDMASASPEFCRSRFGSSFPDGKACCLPLDLFSNSQCQAESRQCYNLIHGSDNPDDTVNPSTCSSENEYFCFWRDQANCCDILPFCDQLGVNENKVCFDGDSLEQCRQITSSLNIYSSKTSDNRLDTSSFDPEYCRTSFSTSFEEDRICCLNNIHTDETECPTDKNLVCWGSNEEEQDYVNPKKCGSETFYCTIETEPHCCRIRSDPLACISGDDCRSDVSMLDANDCKDYEYFCIDTELNSCCRVNPYNSDRDLVQTIVTA
ncbi:MAG: hypothetical protein KKF44_04670, partial [Nanoarchaeota archaeon]|nr:hypothetical protein [Nanoarchaeota archaeon]